MHSRIYNEDIESLIEKAKNGDDDAQRIIVEENIGLVWSAVRRFYNRGHETEDLFQIGCIGLIKAIKKFDFNFTREAMLMVELFIWFFLPHCFFCNIKATNELLVHGEGKNGSS